MGITLHWHNDDKTILRTEFTDPWNWNDFYGMLDEIGQMADEAQINHRVDIINDLSRTLTLPSGALGVFRSASRDADEFDSLVILVSPTSYARAVFDMFRSVYPEQAAHWRIVRSIDEAEAMIAKDKAGMQTKE